jgi:hypothetical protein
MSTAHAAHSAGRHNGLAISRRVMAGVVGGIAGGVVFGIPMMMMGMLPMVAALVGSQSAAVGFAVHLAISDGIGLGLTVLFGSLLSTYPRGAGVGLVYGAIWWVLGALVLMPMMMGIPLFMIDTTAIMSLLGHLIYGLILGLVAAGVPHRGA